MRVTSQFHHDVMKQVTQRTNAQLSDTLIRMTTEQRILRASDDPIGAVRLALLAESGDRLARYRTNITTFEFRLKRGEQALSEIVAQFGEAQQKLLMALDGARAPGDLAAIAGVLESVRDMLLHSSNTRDGAGHYLFSGTAITTAPIAFDPVAPAGSRYAYGGNAGKQAAIVGDGVTEVLNDDLAEMADALNALDRAIERMRAPGANANDSTLRDALVQAIDVIDRTSVSVESKIGRLGNAQNMLTLLDDLHASSQVVTTEAAQDAGKIDRIEVYDAYMSYRTALEATQKVYAQVSQLSLFNVL
ncbi:flagellar biosynthesis protein FlgL [Burkholderia sp. RF4-BP95]|uniref:flagellin N-terminal helical domain-containing protein n=1 Tax=Burkholderia sp. RF4-BP95 TaxID=1637845 RepID=UPI0007548E8A|nr:flagellar biosynthesis protein FlgL [Burkholderia sp. RF4-BP95]KUY72499.1 flagellar biosynthesis protein FlgL [Burkholderia sp. RF4-BP95]